MADLSKSKVVAEFGLAVQSDLMGVNGRVLQPPTMKFLVSNEQNVSVTFSSCDITKFMLILIYVNHTLAIRKIPYFRSGEFRKFGVGGARIYREPPGV